MIVDVVCLASWNADLVSTVERPIERGQTVFASGFEIGPGGKGSNAAVAAARQGAKVAVVARIGDDDFGRMGLDLWAREGIDTRHVEQARGERSGVAQILVYANGDNSIAVFRGAGAGLGAAHADAARTTLEGARVVMAPNEVPIELRTAAFRIARAAGVTTLLNPAPAQDLPDELVALTDVLTPNEGELRALAGGDAQMPLGEAARRLLDRGAGAVLATLGEAGCCLFRRGHEPLAIPGWTVTVADTVGAGDTCTGALAAALARGLALPEAARVANAAAALSVTGHGAITAMPDRAAVERLLATRP